MLWGIYHEILFRLGQVERLVWLKSAMETDVATKSWYTDCVEH